MLTINEPFWKYKGLGINPNALNGCESIEVECAYKDKRGHYVYPHVYKVTKQQIYTGIKHRLKGDVTLSVIPVSDMQIVQYRHANRD